MCHEVGFKDECISPRRVKEGGRWKDRLILSITREQM
jgi:hypothetical protein